MNQSDRIQLDELKEGMLQIVDAVFGVKTIYHSKGAFTLLDLKNLTDMIRINTKYLLFDRECLQREMEHLRHLIKDQGRNVKGGWD